MNYLAHLYLSGDDKMLLLGNFIADHVKGNVFTNYDEFVQRGIRLHRQIDTFTDNHDVVMKGKVRLRPYVSKYAPVALDIIYDHFLAANWKQYHNLELIDYTVKIFNFLDTQIELMPQRTRHMYHYMRRDNWLVSYAQIAGIEQALIGLSRRTKFESYLGNAINGLVKHYDEFNIEFKLFFADLESYISTQKNNGF